MYLTNKHYFTCTNVLKYQYKFIMICSVDERITIGYEPGTNIRGMIAYAPIPAGTLLIHTPGSLVLSSPDDDQCSMIQKVIVDEMKLGENSKWHLYFDVDDSSGSRIPSQWSKTGRAIKELQGLPPAGDTHRHIDWYQSVCLGGKEMTDIDWNAFKMFLTRAADIGLVPLYDLMNHHNGKINTRLERDDSGGLKVYATDDIPENYPIYNTYARSGIESTVDTFNTYGKYPGALVVVSSSSYLHKLNLHSSLPLQVLLKITLNYGGGVIRTWLN